MKQDNPSIPPQREGKQLDLEAKRRFGNEKMAKEYYLLAQRRLLNAFDWYTVARLPAAQFVLSDRQGQEIIRPMREGDLLRIDIPGPGSSSGDGYDWVQVESIRKHQGDDLKPEFCQITLRPTSNPLQEDPEIAHFFKELATSTLLVKREGKEVLAEYHGRNELVNTEASHYTDKIRNIIVGLSAKMGLSLLQWKSLIDGLVEKQEEASR